MRSRWHSLDMFCRIKVLLASVVLLFVYNEYLHYYIVLSQCGWPSLDIDNVNTDDLHAMVLADTHLLGYREGHWFDKLRREWQMERAFQTALWLHSPEAVFVLGDLFDEGKWCDDEEFVYHVDRFKKKFRTPESTSMIVVAGNHDIGFHYMVNDNKHWRFVRAFNASSVRMLTLKKNMFVLLNSMAFEGDGCAFCREAENSLKQIIQTLDCAQGNRKNCSSGDVSYSRPIVLQHFPLYRTSDSHCSGPDAADSKERKQPMRPKWHCLGKEISDQILDKLNPRLVLSGHTHHFCLTSHRGYIPEWTIPSFSWRNKRNPSFLLVKLNNRTFSVNKCHLPDESTVIGLYIVGGSVILLAGLLSFCWKRFRFRHPHHID